MGAKCSACCSYFCDYCCTKKGCTLLCTACCFACKKGCKKCGCGCCCREPTYKDTRRQPLSTELKTKEKQLLVSDSEKQQIKASHIILLGDSVLDDFYWLIDKKLDIRQQMENEFKYDNVIVTNYAVDESETNDVVNGIRPNGVYQAARDRYNIAPYPTENDGIVYPLKLVSQLIDRYNNGNDNDNDESKSSSDSSKKKSNNNEILKMNPTIVLSVGGNDFRMVLGGGDMEMFKYGAQSMIDGMINYGFIKHIEIILSTLLPNNPESKKLKIKHNKELKENVQNLLNLNFKINNNINNRFNHVQLIIVFPYQPGTTWYVYNAVPGNATLNEFAIRQFFNVMQWGFEEVCNYANKFHLPIIDLSRTFDPNNELHFGSTPIEPSNLSGQFIVDLVTYVLKIYNFEDPKQESLIFYGIKQDKDWNGITVEKNTRKARKRYINDIIARNGPILNGDTTETHQFTVGDQRMHEQAQQGGKDNEFEMQQLR